MNAIEISGYWNPIIFLVASLIVAIVSYLIWWWGEGDFSEGKTAKPFLSGNPEFSKRDSHISGENLYWGIKKSLGAYYRWMKRIHTGIINDYMIWYLATVAILLFLFIGVI